MSEVAECSEQWPGPHTCHLKSGHQGQHVCWCTEDTNWHTTEMLRNSLPCACGGEVAVETTYMDRYRTETRFIHDNNETMSYSPLPDEDAPDAVFTALAWLVECHKYNEQQKAPAPTLATGA